MRKNIPEGMTPEKLRAIAEWLDIYDKLATLYIELLVENEAVPPTADAERALAVVRGTGVQDDLKRWADEIEADVPLVVKLLRPFCKRSTETA